MKKFLKNEKNILCGIACLLFFILVGCIFIDSVSVEQIQPDGTKAPKIKADEVATFTLKGNINCAEDHSNVKFVVAMLAPKSWKIRENVKMTYRTTVLSPTWDKEYTMSAIPEAQLPKNGGGATWSDALMKRYGVGNNVLNDMEWVAFQTDDIYDIKNGDKPKFEYTIKCKVGTQNLRAYLGFCVNHTDDGLSAGEDHTKVAYSEAFTVYGGNGVPIDYCSYHYNKTEPLAALQDDFVTFSFQGGVYKNTLISQEKIFMNATAYTENGKYTVTEKSAKTLMKKEGQFSDTYNLTVWPAEFFNIPAGETIMRIDYTFTNEDGSISITQTDNDISSGEIVGDISIEKKPFVFELSCN